MLRPIVRLGTKVCIVTSGNLLAESRGGWSNIGKLKTKSVFLFNFGMEEHLTALMVLISPHMFTLWLDPMHFFEDGIMF